MKCPFCDKPVQPLKGAGRKKIYCSSECRHAFRAKIKAKGVIQNRKCVQCLNNFQAHYGTKFCSKKCKSNFWNPINRTKKTISICTICGGQAIGSHNRVRKYCSFECQLKGIYGGKPPLSERSRKAQRNMRERQAPGMNLYEIGLLRKKWKDEGRSCTYCAGQFDTVDHIIPLTRGGDNMITNLTPACRSCNSSKSSKLLSEWKPDLYASR
ncbi:MAG: HNH endonuclease [Candidatus Nanopelagicaceae bacterium]